MTRFSVHVGLAASFITVVVGAPTQGLKDLAGVGTTPTQVPYVQAQTVAKGWVGEGAIEAADKEVICIGQPNPPGWVTIGYTTVVSCGNRTRNAKTILNINDRPTGTVVTVCREQPNPPGWVTVGYLTNYACGSQVKNAKKIKKL